MMDGKYASSFSLLFFILFWLTTGGCTSTKSIDNSYPEPTPTPTSAPIIYDTDSDNVPDYLDMCPGSPRDRAVDADGCTVYNETSSSGSYPLFPFPVPRPSTSLVGLDIEEHFGDISLEELVQTLEYQLKAAGYRQPSYYMLPSMDGIAVATQLERINRDGVPFEQSLRWLIDDMSLGWNNFSILEYIKVLVGARSGYYRTIVILVKPKNVPLSYGKDIETESEVTEIYTSGAAQSAYHSLRTSITDLDMSFLIYEVERSAVGEDANQVELGVSVQQHFEKTKLNLLK